MNSLDVETIKALAQDAGLTIGKCELLGRQIMLIYADGKHAKPRAIGTIVETLYHLMIRRGVMYGISTGNPLESEFPTLLFTQHEQGART